MRIAKLTYGSYLTYVYKVEQKTRQKLNWGAMRHRFCAWRYFFPYWKDSKLYAFSCQYFALGFCDFYFIAPVYLRICMENFSRSWTFAFCRTYFSQIEQNVNNIGKVELTWLECINDIHSLVCKWGSDTRLGNCKMYTGCNRNVALCYKCLGIVPFSTMG